MRRIVSTNAYAFVSGLPVDERPFTVRQGLARLLVLADVGSEFLDDFEAGWRQVAAESLPDGWELEGETITEPVDDGVDDTPPVPPPVSWHAAPAGGCVTPSDDNTPS